MKLAPTLRRSHGYTIDQTILIVAIIAILVTLIIITVGWNLINKSSGTKLAAQLRQIEDANGQFYSSYRQWPQDSYTAPAATNKLNVIALTGDASLTYSQQVKNSPDAVGGATPKNMISGFKLNGTTNVYHNFGDGAVTNAILEQVVSNPFGLNGNFLVVEFQQVPMSDAKNAEATIDGGSNPSYSTGRFVALTTGDCVTGIVTNAATTATTDSTKVNACYAANLVQ